MDLPITPSFALLSFVTLAATLAGFAPKPILRLLGFAILAYVFTLFAVHFAADTGELVGFLLEPPLPNRYLLRHAWWLPVLLSLTTVATMISWLASFRLCKKFVNDDFVTEPRPAAS